MHKGINDALQDWTKHKGKTIDYIMKGRNHRTEAYSILKAEVVDPEDPMNTALNEDLLNHFKLADRLIICGQSLSHGVNFTVRDIIDHWSKNDLKKIYVLEDGTCNFPQSVS